MSKNVQKRLAFILSLVLAFFFILSGLMKFHSVSLSYFESCGFSFAFMKIVGVLEIAGALGLFYRKWRSFSAFLLMMIVIGAMAVHLHGGEWDQLIFAAVTFILLLASLPLPFWKRNFERQETGGGIREAGGGIREAGFGRRDSGGGIREAGFGRRDSGGGIREAGFVRRKA